MSIGYWGPQIKVGAPQPALNINMDVHSNCEALSFTFDNQLRELPTVDVYNDIFKEPDSHSYSWNITPLSPPLGLVEPIPVKLKPIHGVSKYSIPKAVMIGMAQAAAPPTR